MNKQDKVCIDKSIGIFTLSGLILIALIVTMTSLTQVKTSTSTRASKINSSMVAVKKNTQQKTIQLKPMPTPDTYHTEKNGWMIVDGTNTLKMPGITVYIKEKNQEKKSACHKNDFLKYSNFKEKLYSDEKKYSNCIDKTMVYFVASSNELYMKYICSSCSTPTPIPLGQTKPSYFIVTQVLNEMNEDFHKVQRDTILIGETKEIKINNDTAAIWHGNDVNDK